MKKEILDKLKKLDENGIEYEVLIRERGESKEEEINKFLGSKIFSEQMMAIGKI